MRIFLLSALLCGQTAMAKDKPAAPEIQTATAAAALPITSSDVLKGLEAWDTKLDSLQASFEQTTYLEGGAAGSPMTGNIRYLKPNHLRMEYTAPVKQIVYTDKNVIWIYKPEDAQVLKAKWQEWIKQQSASLTGIADFGSYSALLEKHKLAIEDDPKTGVVKASLSPRSNPKLYTLTLTLSRQDFFPLAIRFTVGKTVMETVLKNVERNAPMPKEIFDFATPKGVSEITFD